MKQVEVPPTRSDAQAGSPSRTMRADAVKNRRRILVAAEEVFAAEGVGAPIDLVAERAGVGVGTLYRHFPTKEALYEAIVVTRLQDLIDASVSALDSDDPGDALFCYLREFARQASIKHDLFDALSSVGVDIKSKCAGRLDDLQTSIERLLERAAAVGAVRDDVTTNDVIGLVVGAAQAAATAATGGGLGPTSCERMVDVVCDGLRPRP